MWTQDTHAVTWEAMKTCLKPSWVYLYKNISVEEIEISTKAFALNVNVFVYHGLNTGLFNIHFGKQF